MKNCLVVALSVALAVACGRTTSSNANANSNVPLAQLPTVDSNALLSHTRVLSSDEYEGRGPGTKGEELTVRYLTEQYQRLGLKPGNPDGTYVQKVPLVGFTGAPTASFNVGGKQINLTV